MRFILTNQGVSLVNNTLQLPQTLTYVLGTGSNYAPAGTDTNLHGLAVITGITDPVIITDGVPTYEVAINVSAFPGGITFGEIGLFDGPALIALACDSTTTTVASGQLKIDCILSQASGGAAITTARSALKIDYVDSAASIPNARIAPSNVYIISGRNVLASTQGSNPGYWDILGGIVVAKNTQVLPGPVAPSSSAIAISAPSGIGIGSDLFVSAISGTNKGVIRLAQVVLNEFGNLSLSFSGNNVWSSPFQIGDLVNVYDDAPSSSSFATILTSAQFTGGTVDNMAIGATTPSTGRFTALQVQTSAQLGATQAASIDATPIGQNVAANAAFINVYTSNNLTVGDNAQVAGNLVVSGNTTLGQATAHSLVAQTIQASNGSLDGVAIGSTSPSTGRFLALEVDQSLNITGAAVFASGAAFTGNTTFTGTVSLPANLAINNGTINGTSVGATVASSGRFTSVVALNNLTVGQNLTVGGQGSFTGAVTANVFTSPSVSITGGHVDGTDVGNTFPAAGSFTTLAAQSLDNTPIGINVPSTAKFTAASVNQLDVNSALNIYSTEISIPNGVDFGLGTLLLDPANQRVGVNVPPSSILSYNFTVGGDVHLVAPSGAYIRSVAGLPVLSTLQAIAETHICAPYLNGKVVFKQGVAGVETGQLNANGYLKVSPNAYYIYGSVTNSHELSSNDQSNPVSVQSANNVLFGSDVNRSFSQAAAATGFNHYNAYTSGSSVYKVQGNGNVLNTYGVYASLSDSKLKQQITPATGFLAGLNQIQVVNYKLNSDVDAQLAGGPAAPALLGVIAQQLATVFPGLVFSTPDFVKVATGGTDANGNPIFVDQPTGTSTLAVKYSVFVPMLIQAVQELSAQNTAFQTYASSLTMAFSDVYARLDALDNQGPTSPPVFPF